MTRFGSLVDPPAALLLLGARVVDPSTGIDTVGDLAVLDGRFIEPAMLPAEAVRVDAGGLLAIPALCDLHTHLRQPGDEAARVAHVQQLARGTAARVRVVAAATRGRGGERLTELSELSALGIVGVSDDGVGVASPRLARALLAYLAPLGLPLIEHAEDPHLAEGGVMRSGPVASRLGLGGWPASAELVMVERDIALAAETGGWVHFTHLSTRGALDAVRRAKAAGIRVTCDVTPHHLAMTDAWVAGERRFAWEETVADGADPDGGPLDEQLAYDGSCRVNPPLPTRADALALLAGVADGTVDAIATDHAPHPSERKLVEFAAAAPGMIGLETALSLGLAAVAAGCLDLATVVSAMATRPAALIGEQRSLAAGAVAALTLVDPSASWRVEPAALASASANTPLLGRDLPGVVRLTLAAGRVTYAHGLSPLD